MIRQHPRAEEYTALSDRMSYLLLLRVGLAAVVIAWAAIRPEVLGTSLRIPGRHHRRLPGRFVRSRSGLAAVPAASASPC